MSQQKIGDLTVTGIGAGLMGMHIAYEGSNSLTDEYRDEFLNQILAKGCNLWDTAQAYIGSEHYLGGYFTRHNNRDKVILCTKGGPTMREGQMMVDNSAAHLRASVENSLKEMQTTWIDIYYIHRIDDATLDEGWAELAKCVQEGKIKYLGLSEATAEQIRRVHAIHPVTVVQQEYSLGLRQEVEQMLLPTTRELGISIVCYSPLARGIFTKTINSFEDLPKDFRASVPYLQKEQFDENVKLIHKVQEIAKRENCDTSALALAWLLKQGKDIIAIPGTTKIANFDNNWAAVQLVESLDEKVFLELTELSKHGFVGDRYGEGMNNVAIKVKKD